MESLFFIDKRCVLVSRRSRFDAEPLCFEEIGGVKIGAPKSSFNAETLCFETEKGKHKAVSSAEKKSVSVLNTKNRKNAGQKRIAFLVTPTLVFSAAPADIGTNETRIHIRRTVRRQKTFPTEWDFKTFATKGMILYAKWTPIYPVTNNIVNAEIDNKTVTHGLKYSGTLLADTGYELQKSISMIKDDVPYTCISYDAAEGMVCV